MLSDGVYGLDYQATSDKSGVIGAGLAMLRGGKIIGTDRCGSVFIGAYEYDRHQRVSRVSVRMHAPPGGELVTGMPTGAEGATYDIVASIDEDTLAQATIEVAGLPVTVKLTYIGPLPL